MKKLLTIISSFALGVLVYFIPSSQLDAQASYPPPNYCQAGIQTSVCQEVPPMGPYFGGYYCVHNSNAAGCLGEYC
jgi:hypothetical protein